MTQQIPSSLTGEFQNIWKGLASQVDGQGEVTVTDKAKFSEIESLATLGGVTILEKTDDSLKVRIEYEPDVPPTAPSVEAASKPTKFAKRADE